MTGPVINLAAVKARPRVAMAIDLARAAGLAPGECSPAIFDRHHRSEPDPTLVGLGDLALRLAALVDAALAEPEPTKAVEILRTGSEQLLGPFPATAA